MTTKSKEPRLREIAERIGVHLKRFESDPKINVRRRYNTATCQWEIDSRSDGLATYYQASAQAAGSRMRIKYISYQHGILISRQHALEYLAWLDAGGVGQLHDFEKSTGKKVRTTS